MSDDTGANIQASVTLGEAGLALFVLTVIALLRFFFYGTEAIV